jgi:hypothetical protein
MRLSRSAVILTALLALSAAFAAAPARADDATPPKPLVEQRGLPMSAQEAMERITFRPFVPAANYSQVALLPAFHGDDKDSPQNRGIGYEYTSAGHTYLLREWPLAGGSLDRYPAIKPEGTCSTGRSVIGSPDDARGLAWSTSTLAFALQPDTFGGPTDVRALHTEWARLIKRGACR